MAAPDFYSVAPDCIKHDLPPASAPATAEILEPFKDCTGFFTFGGGKIYAGAPFQPFPEGAEVGQVLQDPAIGLLIWTAIGFTVMVLAFIAWVRLEHRKLTAQAERLRAAGGPRVGGPAAPGAG